MKKVTYKKSRFILKAAIVILAFMSILPLSLLSENKDKTGKSWQAKPFERKAFIENKGQFVAELPESKKNYNYLIDNGNRVFFYNNEILFAFEKPRKQEEGDEEEKEDPKEEREREMRMLRKDKQLISMKWLNANPDATIEVTEEQTVDYGYVLTARPKNYTVHCKGYSRLKIKNLYPGVDAEYFFTEKDGFKYNLYVSPGADISNIKQSYSGSKNIALVDGNIVIKTIKGDIIDHAPVSYATNNEDQKIASSFVLKKNTVSFNITNSSNQAITIDPWVAVPIMPLAPVDNGTDKYGNTYVTNPNYILEKYSPTGALVSSTDVMAGGAIIFGDMLTNTDGYCFFNTVIGSQPRGNATAVDDNGNFLWDSFGINECWRFVLNECNNQVLSLTGFQHSATGFAKIDAQTGALTGYVQSGNCCEDPHCGVIDNNGDVYCVVSGAGTQIFKWTAANAVAATYPAPGSWGYGTGYVGDGAFAQGYNGMALLGDNLYMFDGADLFKVDKNNGNVVAQVAVPGGVNKMNGGIYITGCGQLFVGSGTGVYMFDRDLNQLDFKATTGPVFDLSFNTFNQTISVCGPGHVTELSFVIPPCVFEINPVIINPCGNAADKSIKLNLTGGAPNYTYVWSGNGLVANTDSVGNLTPGTYKCVYSDSKCPTPNKDSIEIIVPFKPIPTAQFLFENKCYGSATPLTDSSYFSLGAATISTWKWNFGDGGPLYYGQTVTGGHQYLNPGTYSIKLIVVTDSGCVDSITKQIDVFPIPVSNFSAANVCLNQPMNFTDLGAVAAGNVSGWLWNFGDNSAEANTNNPNHVYADTGTFSVSLIITSNNGCKDTVIKPVLVHPLPDAQFTVPNVCEGGIALFTDQSTMPAPDNIQIWSWDFGDGSPLKNNQNTTHLYPNAGAFTTELIVTSNFGCKDSISKVVVSNPNPNAVFTAIDTVGCSPLCVNFQNNSSIASGSNTAFHWSYGEPGAEGTDSLGYYCYTNLTGNSNSPTPYTFDVYLTVTSDSGCITVFHKDNYITVNPNPVAQFAAQPEVVSIINPEISVNNTSLGAVTWDWNFGDSTTSIVQAPEPHVYADTGNYNIQLIISNQYGCFDTTYRTITIEPDWAFFIPNVFTPNGDGINETFQGFGFGLLKYNMSIFDRWGELIYKTDNYDKPWDGRANDGKRAAQQDVYIYQFVIADIKDKKHVYTGTVTLAR